MTHSPGAGKLSRPGRRAIHVPFIEPLMTHLPAPFRATALALSLLAGPALAVDYDVYLLAGQSNMDGRGPVKDLVGPLAPFAGVRADAVIWYSNSSLRMSEARSQGWQPLRPGFSVPPMPAPRRTTTPPATTQSTTQTMTAATTTAPSRPPPGGIITVPPRPATRPTGAATRPRPPRTVPGPAFGPEIGFAQTLTDAGLPAGRKIAIVKFAVSGANLRVEWNPATRGQLYDQFLPYARQGLAELAKPGDTVTLRGFLWHQGESDIALAPTTYQQLLAELIARVRQDFGSPDLPVYLGEPYDNGRRLNVRAGQLLAARAIPNVYVIGSRGLETYDRGTHFDAPSQIELGRRFARAVLTQADVMPSTMPTTRPATTPAGEDPP